MSSPPEPHIVYRYVSHLVKDTFALVLAGGRGSRLHELTEWRAKPAVFLAESTGLSTSLSPIASIPAFAASGC